ncbi:MAG: hypothetical protein Q8R96_11605 [Bacteroidota bacterium]|nr:hypothetical protein [Bacteroidota bacterium]
MSEYFYFRSNKKDINRLIDYLKALAEKPESGVFVTDFEDEEIKELRKKISNELMKDYQKRQLQNPANADDIIVYPKENKK